MHWVSRLRVASLGCGEPGLLHRCWAWDFTAASPCCREKGSGGPLVPVGLAQLQHVWLSNCTGLAAPSLACGISDQRWSLCPLPWQTDLAYCTTREVWMRIKTTHLHFIVVVLRKRPSKNSQLKGNFLAIGWVWESLNKDVSNWNWQTALGHILAWLLLFCHCALYPYVLWNFSSSYPL